MSSHISSRFPSRNHGTSTTYSRMYVRGGSCDGADHCGHDVGVLPESDPAERGDLPAPTLECVLKGRQAAPRNERRRGTTRCHESLRLLLGGGISNVQVQKISDWFPQMEPGKRSHTGGLRDRNPRRLLRHTPPGTRTVLGPTVRRPPTFRQPTVRVSSFSHHQPAVMAITKWSIQAPSSKKAPPRRRQPPYGRKAPPKRGQVYGLSACGRRVFGSSAAGQCGNSGHEGWFLGGKHSVPECCRGATEAALLMCSPPNAN
jgi:hypothetical protein